MHHVTPCHVNAAKPSFSQNLNYEGESIKIFYLLFNFSFSLPIFMIKLMLAFLSLIGNLTVFIYLNV